MLLEHPSVGGASIKTAEQYLAAGRWRKTERACHELLACRNEPQAAFILGQMHRALRNSTLALEWFGKVIEWSPARADAHFACGELYLISGNPHAAAQSWIAGLEQEPAYLPAHLGLADALLRLGLYDSAEIAARQALVVEPESPSAWERLADATEGAGKIPEAIRALEKYCLLVPESAEVLRRAGLLHARGGDPQRGCNLLARAIKLQPRNAGLHFSYAQVLRTLGEHAEAISHLKLALRFKPHFPEALSNLGMLLRANLLFDEAESCYKKACAQNPSFALAWNNLANLYVETVRHDDAERCYGQAIAVAPEYAEAHTGRAMLRLLKGQFQQGWAEYEWRWHQPGIRQREFTQFLWDGSNLQDRTILLHAEQGAGDTIQFIRYAGLLKAQGARVVVHCPTPLRTLIERMPEVDQVFCGQETTPPFDVHAPLMSLPRLFGTELADIPSAKPYLTPPSHIDTPDALIKAQRLRVGLVWAGNPKHHNDRNRSITPNQLRPLLAIHGVNFFSLQVGAAPPVAGEGESPIVDLAPFLTSYDATAACLAQLDLLITVDTSVAHLAGALGRPVWLMLPVCNDWRWLEHRSDSPWYPSMRIFRQETSRDWAAVLQRIETECRLLVGRKG